MMLSVGRKRLKATQRGVKWQARSDHTRPLLKGSPTPWGGPCGLWVGGLVWFGAIWAKVPPPPLAPVTRGRMRAQSPLPHGPPLGGGGGVGSGWVGGWVRILNGWSDTLCLCMRTQFSLTEWWEEVAIFSGP